MNRRDFIGRSLMGITGALSAAAGIHITSCGTDNTQTPRPNIVLISMDDAGWHDFGYHGSMIKTPTIDRMVREGVELNQFYASPVCTPTRASLMIGRPASRIGITQAIGAHEDNPMTKDTITIAEVLRRSGYDTALTGKWHLGNTLDHGPNAFGFNHGHGFHGPWCDFYTHRTQKDKYDWHRNGEYVEEEGHCTDLETDFAIDFMSSTRDKSKPFFIYVSYNAPHLPLQEDEKWIAPYRDVFKIESRQYYAAMVTHVDASIQRILETLDKEGLSKDTLVLFFSDNGGERPGKKGYIDPVPEYRTTSSIERYADNAPLRGWKGELYEGGVRVPACAYWPGILNTHKNDQPLAVYDILPTLASLTESPIPDGMNVEGVNIWPSLESRTDLPERTIYWHIGKNLAVRKGDWKLIHFGATPSEGKDELYNLADDPFEQYEMCEDRPGMLATLKEELERQFAMD